MKHSDFHIGLEFMGIAGFWWRCTDVGTRTIVAVQLDRDDPNWYLGPPYIAKEVVFAYFSPSWTAFQADGGRHFRLIVDGISAGSWTLFQRDRGRWR